MFTFAVACRALLIVVFAVAVAGKARNFPDFTTSVRRLAPRLPARVVARVVMSLEAVIVVLLAVPQATVAAAGSVLAGGLLAAFSVAIAAALRRGSAAPCKCFGRATTPLGPRHLARNVFLMAVAVAALAASADDDTATVAAYLVAGAAGALAGLVVVVLDDVLDLFREPAGV
ncbi:MauE/DoxX family redox-associated membrane protein [Actinoplanes sp. NPDC049548]|uniref:MauE/DoxX family redox-associated membrane protein n=1 Tax=Actinoplanes sp. NPDC049548 TaxID=3155152 RepID=UPI00342F7AB9